MVRSAPILREDPPTVNVLEDHVDEGRRHLRLRIHSPPATFRTEVRDVGDVEVDQIRVDGRPFDAPGGDLVQFFGPPAEGFELELTADADRPLRLRLRAVLAGLPDAGARPRPDHMMTGPVERDLTRIQRTVDLGTGTGPP
jgi:hypothetical protein